jgi:hypothetical protein
MPYRYIIHFRSTIRVAKTVRYRPRLVSCFDGHISEWQSPRRAPPAAATHRVADGNRPRTLAKRIAARRYDVLRIAVKNSSQRLGLTRTKPRRRRRDDASLRDQTLPYLDEPGLTRARKGLSRAWRTTIFIPSQLTIIERRTGSAFKQILGETASKRSEGPNGTAPLLRSQCR